MSTATNDVQHAVFSFPRLSRKVNRDLWIDRFVASMLMDSSGELPENTSWVTIAPENWPEGIDFVPAHFDLIAVSSGDMELLERKYHEYRDFMRVEYGDFADLDIEEFLPAEMVFYTPDQSDHAYDDTDFSARDALAHMYESDDDDEGEGEEDDDDMDGLPTDEPMEPEVSEDAFFDDDLVQEASR